MGDVIPYRPRRSASPAGPDQRARIEGALALALDAVEHLVAALDTMDGDPDREDGAEAEPSLGAPDGHDSQVGHFRGSGRDLEIDRQGEDERRPETGTPSGPARDR